MKYEIFQVTKGDMQFEIGLMHHEQLTHADVAEHMQVCISMTFETGFDDVKVVGAGFCSSGVPVKCWGHSESLNIHTRGQADELVLMASMLNFESVPTDDAEMIRNVLQNFSQSCGVMVSKAHNQLCIVGHEIVGFDLATGESADFEEGMLLRYRGPTLNADGRVAHLFVVDSSSKYYGDYDSVYSFSASNLFGIHKDHPMLRKLAKVQCAVINVDGVAKAVNIHGVIDLWPMGEPHDQMMAYYVLLGGGEKQKFHGSLEQMLEFFNLDGE